MADRHDSRTGRDETLSPTIPVDRTEAPGRADTRDERTEREGKERAGGGAVAAKQKADAQGEADRKRSDDARDKAETDAITARRKAEDEARAAAKHAAATSAKDAAARREGGIANYVGLSIGGDEPVYIDNPAVPPGTHERTLTIHGLNYEHVDTDADGVWLYRAMK